MWLYYLLISVFAMQRHWFWSLQLAGHFTTLKLLGLLVLCYSFIYGASKGHFSRLVNRTSLIFCLLFTLITLSYYISADWGSTAFEAYLSIFGLLISTILLVDSWGKLKLAVLAALVGSCWGGLYVIREYQMNSSFNSMYRPGFIVGDPNLYAAGVVICVPLSIAYFSMESRKIPRLIGIGSLLISIVALVVTASRGAFVALAAFAVYGVLFSRRYRKHIVLLTLILAAILAGAPNSPVRRLLHPDTADNESTNLRRELLDAGVEMIRQNPVFGVGLGQFKVHTEGKLSKNLALTAHDMYVDLAAELGIPALLLFLLLIVSAWRNLAAIQRQQSRADTFDVLVFCFRGSFITFLVAALFIGAQYQRYFWLVLFLATSASFLAVNDNSANEGSRPKSARTKKYSFELDTGEVENSQVKAGATVTACESQEVGAGLHGTMRVPLKQTE